MAGSIQLSGAGEDVLLFPTDAVSHETVYAAHQERPSRDQGHVG